jgi:GNAT superfamily N-acetyltransferase
MRLEHTLRSDPTLARYDVQIYPELISLLGIDEKTLPTSDLRSCLHLFNVQVQIMENVFYAINLGEYHAHQLNRGWINLFRRWTAKDTFRRLWPGLRATFSKAFVDFAEYHLNLTTKIEVCHLTDHLRSAWVEETQPIARELEQEWPKVAPKRFWRRFTEGEPLVILIATTETVITDARLMPLGPKEALGVAAAMEETGQVTGQEHGTGTMHVMVWVRGAHRRAGIGKALLSALMSERLIKEKDHVIAELPLSSPEKLGYREEIAGWLRFYEQFGFVRSLEPDKVDRLYLELSLR